MKHILTRVLSWAVLAAAAAGSTSCLNEYLDKAPDAGLDEKEVFSKYANFKSYFYAVYNGANFNIKAHYPQWFAGNNQKFTMEGLTDMCDMTRIQRCQPGKQGDGSTVIYAVGYNSDASSKTAKVPYSWKSIRVANMTIRNIDMLQDATDREKKDLLAQAYFVRAYCHFELFRLYGSLPYIDKVMGSEDEWDLPRLSDYDMLQRIAADFQTAADIFDQAGLMRRDPASGSGHLAATDQDKPNGVTALAMKGRVLLYSASPLSNPGNDISRWEEAAEANWTALKSALDHGYLLLAKEKYTDNFYGTKYTNEHIWAWNYGSSKINTSTWSGTFAYPASNYTNGSGDCPTQNFVDRFETLDGDPLLTEADREAAAKLGHYDEQDPYSNRDPRFDKTILHDGSVVSGCPTGINIHYDPATGTYPVTSLNNNNRSFGIAWGSNDSKGYSNTGYYVNKLWNGQLGTSAAHQHTDPLIRMAELYLNYAEAANEAYGPDGRAGGLPMTALDAVNKVRNRAGMPDVLDKFTGSAPLLRERIRNERCVELAFEGHHYYHDIRRWKIAPQTMSQTLTGMYIEKVPVSDEYPCGRRYVRQPIPNNRQSNWKNAMYYLPFPAAEANKMKNFVNDELW